MLILADLEKVSQHSLLVCKSVDDQKMQCKERMLTLPRCSREFGGRLGEGRGSWGTCVCTGLQDLAFRVGLGCLNCVGQVGSRLQAAGSGAWRNLGDAKDEWISGQVGGKQGLRGKFWKL